MNEFIYKYITNKGGEATMEKIFYSVRELATLINTTEATVRAFLYRTPDRLPKATKLGSRTVFHVDDINDWAQKLRKAGYSPSTSTTKRVGRPRKSETLARMDESQ